MAVLGLYISGRGALFVDDVNPELIVFQFALSLRVFYSYILLY